MAFWNAPAFPKKSCELAIKTGVKMQNLKELMTNFGRGKKPWRLALDQTGDCFWGENGLR
ncbi:MAG: hypothetical protein CM15mP17_08270 [Gammaproteobacteria bacterium]|nr:MAG: hypothetical protein CM15mP17_08270 [Gammaproteobacteria bacterium]